ncbi:immunity 49 family protein [Pseudoalteromonas sp. SWXJZ94C]|uniref:immunity 49 family protein n=1 Tax=Pseudoalteromonas sp. SWXJZ94C TaxID=2792065 RepID=UPI0018CDECCA|nr:immunity 49 family protein [Pseudoalteromonas sp. SWXJZ94C]MBH0059430.1 immunity 49 family protein [Pseudoalteromonas sp. SWXJZ94C]
MITITRDYEPTFLDHDTERFEEIYDDSIEDVSIKRDNLISVFGNAITICQWWSFDLTQENKQKSITALKLAAKAGEAIFRLGREPEKEQRVVIDDILDATYNGKGMLWQGGFLSGADWQKAFFCAAIVRDQDAMDSLAKFPVSVMRQCSTTNSEAEYALVELIQAIHRRIPRDECLEVLRTALAELDKESATDMWVNYCTGGKTGFILAFMMDGEVTPSTALANALTDSWDYCERYRDLEGYEQPDFYMPIVLLGLTCMAKDLGNEINVLSDFIPQFYIDGDYL